MNRPILIKRIEQKDNYSFLIEWSDAKQQIFRLSTLQKMCPCANCIDEKTGQRLLNPITVKENVTAHVINSVGRYAIKIQFVSGCSTGIFSFEMLRQLGTPVSS